MKPRTLALALTIAASACDPGPAGGPSVAPPSETPAILAPEPDRDPPRWRALAIDDSYVGAAYAVGCALDQGGALWCWGEDAALQVGLRAAESDAPLASPAERAYAPLSRVEGIEKGVSLALSLDLTCVIDASRALRCHDLRSPEWWTPTPGVEVRHVEVSGERGCALSMTGEALCWNERGPAELLVEEVVAMTLDRERGCLVSHAGELACWTEGESLETLGPLAGVRDLALRGDRLVVLDDAGRLHVHSFDASRASAGRDWVSGGRVEQGAELGLGLSHTCVRSERKSLECRGRAPFGQRGEGSSSPRERFASVEGLTPIHALAASDSRTCVLTHDAIVCAGLDRSLERQWHQHTLPGLRAQSLAAHGSSTCAHDEHDKLLCWGSGMLAPSSFRFGMDIQSGALPEVRAEGIGELRGLRASFGSQAWAGGDGQLHHAMWIDSQGWVEALIRDLVPPAGPILTLAAGDVACAIEAASPTKQSLACGRIPEDRVPIPGAEQVRALAIGARRVCMVDDQGAIACGIHPDLGEAGTLSLTPVNGVKGARRLAATLSQVCALDQAGHVWCWSDQDRPRELELTGVTALAATDSGFCSLDEAGVPSCWTLDQNNALQPAPTPTLDGPQVELVAGSAHFCSRDTEGRVSCWGRENLGQLGRIPAAVSLVFQPIAGQGPT